jgi:hypothetical protein
MFERLNKVINKLDEIYDAIGGDSSNSNMTEYERYEKLTCDTIKHKMRMKEAIALAPGNISSELRLRMRNGIYKYDDLISDEEINKIITQNHGSIEIPV